MLCKSQTAAETNADSNSSRPGRLSYGEVGALDCSFLGVVLAEDSALLTLAAREWSRKECFLDLLTDFPAPYLDEKLSPWRGLFRTNMSRSCWISTLEIFQGILHIDE